MYLYIDTHDRTGYTVGTLAVDRVRVKRFEGRSQGMLPKLDAVMKRAKGKAWKGIVVVAGPGSFSAVRTGVLDANLLSRFLRLPLYAVTVTETAQLDRLVERLEAGEFVPQSYVAPVYDAEPNITIPKRQVPQA